MRIGIDARELTGEATGVGRVIAGFLEAWPADDELILYARRPVPWEFLGGRRRGRVVPGPARLPGAAWEQTVLARELSRDRVAALFSPAYGMPIAAPCGVVVGMHDCACEATPWEFGWRERRRRRWAARAACRRARYLLVGSRFAAEELRRWYAAPRRRIVTAPYGVGASFRDFDGASTAAVRDHYGLGNQSVLFVGAPLERRGLGALIEAIGELRVSRPDVRLCIVGPERRGSPMYDLGATERDRAGVRWLGYVPENDLPAVYGAATVVAYPSSYEGFGFPVLEALACGTPVVASNAGSLAEIFADKAWLVENQPQAWRNALATLLDRPEERQRWVRRAQPWARRRDWAAAARLLRRLLAEGAPDNGAVRS